MNKRSLILAVLAFFTLVSVTSCNTKKLAEAAPLNSTAALEKLADAYQEMSDQLPVSPIKLPPKASRKFVEDVFTKAGFGYSETLKSLAEVKSENITKLHRDMLELVFMPHHRLQQDSLKNIYTDDEAALIEKINSLFK